uniref:Uncharacterized protein n=1 Tax=Acrobeloides nanus TaxID=290746 RepID=A0A914EJX9_9BILA
MPSLRDLPKTYDIAQESGTNWGSACRHQNWKPFKAARKIWNALPAEVVTIGSSGLFTNAVCSPDVYQLLSDRNVTRRMELFI